MDAVGNGFSERRLFDRVCWSAFAVRSVPEGPLLEVVSAVGKAFILLLRVPLQGLDRIHNSNTIGAPPSPPLRPVSAR